MPGRSWTARGLSGVGLAALESAVLEAWARPSRAPRPALGEDLEAAIAAVRSAMNGTAPADGSDDWVATKLLLGDPLFVQRARQAGASGQAALTAAAEPRALLEARSRRDVSLLVMQRYRRFVDGLLAEVLRREARPDARALSDRIDRLLAHRALGLPFFFAVMYAVFWLTFTVGELPMGWIEAGFGRLGEALSGLWPQGSRSPLRSLLVDGVIGGVGGVLVFLPNIVLLFACLVLLEDTGYMARAAFLTDRLMHRFGLHGRSFLPLMTGFGCSVPGIMATRTLESERDRLTTMLVLPLISCGARLPIWMLLIPAFFAPPWRAPMLWLVYAIGVALALGLALLLRRSVLRGADAPFVMELPPYRLPTLRAVLSRTAERALAYLRKAGTVILGISILMWAITTYPDKERYDIDRRLLAGEVQVSDAELDALRAGEDLRHSIAGRIGRALEPLIAPLGFDWKIGTALVGAFAAKEVFVAQLGIVYSLGEADAGSSSLQAALRRDYPPLTGLCLMLFLLIATPCMATFAVTRRESGSWRWAALQFFGLSGVAYLLVLVINQAGRLLA